MFFAILSTFFESLGMNLWKKALSFWVEKNLFRLMWYSSIFFVSIILYIFNIFDFSWFNIFHIFLIIVVVVIGHISILIWQYVYSKEKISSLAPYSNTSKIVTIILSFIIFSDISNISLYITLFTMIIIVISSIDIKALKISTNIWLYILSEIIRAWTLLVTWYILLYMHSTAYFFISLIIGIFFVLLIVLKKWSFKTIKTIPKNFYYYRIIASHLWWFGLLFSLILISELWLSTSIILSFLWMAMTLFISYLINKDIPTKKSISLTIVVSILVWLWYYFK